MIRSARDKIRKFATQLFSSLPLPTPLLPHHSLARARQGACHGQRRCRRGGAPRRHPRRRRRRSPAEQERDLCCRRSCRPGGRVRQGAGRAHLGARQARQHRCANRGEERAAGGEGTGRSLLRKHTNALVFFLRTRPTRARARLRPSRTACPAPPKNPFRSVAAVEPHERGGLGQARPGVLPAHVHALERDGGGQGTQGERERQISFQSPSTVHTLPHSNPQPPSPSARRRTCTRSPSTP
jgi:hypothetical protein